MIATRADWASRGIPRSDPADDRGALSPAPTARDGKYDRHRHPHATDIQGAAASNRSPTTLVGRGHGDWRDGPFTVSAAGTTTVTYQQRTKPDNVEAAKTLTVRIDRYGPRAHAQLLARLTLAPNHRLVNITPTLSVAPDASGPVSVTGPTVTSNERWIAWAMATRRPTGSWRRASATGAPERGGGGAGRVPRSSYTLTDQAGNSSTVSAWSPCRTTAGEISGREKRRPGGRLFLWARLKSGAALCLPSAKTTAAASGGNSSLGLCRLRHVYFMHERTAPATRAR